MKNSIKYQYAENSTGRLINVNTINKDEDNREKYFCLECRQELIARLGNQNVHHFAHKNDTYNCSKESYLHLLGKKVFYETYFQCIVDNNPFYVCTSLFNTVSGICKYNGNFDLKYCKKNGISKFDLISNFKCIEYEKKQVNLIPDLTLKNNYGDIIFVEIAVTHPSEKNKIESKNKIIEISIKNEKDINIILSKSLSEDNRIIKLYNFENSNVYTEPICNENSKVKYLILLKNGEENLVNNRRELCKYIFENKDNVISFKINSPIIKKRKGNYNRGGPRINDIESKYFK